MALAPTTTGSNCIVKSQTLVAGESFILPPGATLIGASNPSNFTSTCPIPALETPECYVFQIVSTSEVSGTTVVFKQSNVYVDALYDADAKVEYPMPLISGMDNIENLLSAAIDQTPISSMLTNRCVAGDFGDNGRGRVVALTFATVPSLGDNLFLKIHTAALLGPDFTEFLYLKAIKIADADGTFCPCSLNQS